jgi:type VI secretion system protein ImpF
VSRADYDVRVTPSVLDRLLDADPKNSREIVPSRAESVRELRRAVQRDLEHLLNARNPYPDLSPAFVEAWQSVLTYGLPDFASMNASNSHDQNRLRQLIENAIRTFEPRLVGVTATFIPTSQTERSLCLRVDARLMMDPAPEQVSFDIVMPMQTLKAEVKEAS